MLSAVFAILKAVAVLVVVGFLVVYFVQYGLPLLAFAVRFITTFLSFVPAWVHPFVWLSVGVSVLCLVVRLL